MAGFEGIQWASRQMRYLLIGKQFEMMEAEAKVFAVSRSIHYGAFLAFEGIRFFCKKTANGRPEVIFLNWDKNLERFRRGMSFNLGRPPHPPGRGAARADRSLGEPFCGVVIPHIVRALGVNKTGCLKLGVNYLMSVKAVDEAKRIAREAGS